MPRELESLLIQPMRTTFGLRHTIACVRNVSSTALTALTLGSLYPTQPNDVVSVRTRNRAPPRARSRRGGATASIQRRRDRSATLSVAQLPKLPSHTPELIEEFFSVFPDLLNVEARHLSALRTPGKNGHKGMTFTLHHESQTITFMKKRPQTHDLETLRSRPARPRRLTAFPIKRALKRRPPSVYPGGAQA